MTQVELKTLPSSKLFFCCATYFDDDRYWDEFVNRFNPCLTNSVYQIYRRFSIDGAPSLEAISDLLQEIYVKILKDKCAALERFRGSSEFEAEVYLMHIATSVTIDHLRRQRSLKRRARTEPLDRALIVEEIHGQREKIIKDYTDELAENDVIRILKSSFRGRNRKRNILIFLLHFREGLTPHEIAEIDLFELRASSVSHILADMREKLREAMFFEKAP
jgi:RNA polymerase sigma factor (sigma-70 family)